MPTLRQEGAKRWRAETRTERRLRVDPGPSDRSGLWGERAKKDIRDQYPRDAGQPENLVAISPEERAKVRLDRLKRA